MYIVSSHALFAEMLYNLYLLLYVLHFVCHLNTLLAIMNDKTVLMLTKVCNNGISHYITLSAISNNGDLELGKFMMPGR